MTPPAPNRTGPPQGQLPAEVPSADIPTAPAASPLNFSTVVSLMAAIPLLLYLLSFLAPWFLLGELVVHFQAQWLVGMLAGAAALLLCRRWWTAGLLLGFAATALLGILPIYFPDAAYPSPESAVQLRVMSFNVLVSNRQHAEVLAEVDRQAPDVLVIVEYTPAWAEALQPLHSQYPYRFEQARWHGFGIALFSKRPLIRAETIPQMPEANELPVIRAVVEFDGQPMEIIGAHLINPLGTDRWRLRRRQFTALGETLATQPAERIVVGDFNCTTWSEEMRDFLQRAQLRDSRKGFGLQPSWNPSGMGFLAIPIDHALVTPGISVVNRQTGARAGSDHRPVIVDLAWGDR